MEAMAVGELSRRPHRPGEPITLWRTLAKRRVDPFDEEPRRPRSSGNLPVVAAVALALFLLVSLQAYGPRLWHLAVVVGVGLLLVRRRV
jgi:hypothetical protein